MPLLERFLGLVGLSRAPAPILGEVVPHLPLSLQLLRLGGAITPQQVSEIYRLADVGYMWQLQDLSNESRQKDGHLQSILGTRENALKGLRWQLVCDEKARKKDRRAAEWCEKAIRASKNFPDLVAHLNGAVFHGYGVAETLYHVVDGRLAPKAFKPIPPRRFVFEQSEGRLQQWDAYGGSLAPYPGVDLMARYPGKFLTHQPRVNGDVPVREGLNRVLNWAALFRNWDIRDWLSLGELAWKPWRMGTYKKGADKTSIDNLRSILRQMSASGVATKPEDAQIEIHWPKGNTVGGTHKELAEFLGGEMSKAVLGQTLTTEAGSRGARSLGEVHDKVRRDILEGDALDVAACITRDLVAPLIAMNFGDTVDVPQFVFVTVDGVNLKDYSAAILNFQKAGLRIKASDVRDVAGFSEPDDDDELLGIEVDFEDDAQQSTDEQAPESEQAPPSSADDGPVSSEAGGAAGDGDGEDSGGTGPLNDAENEDDEEEVPPTTRSPKA